MDSFVYRGGQLYAEGVSVRRIVGKVGTPAYIYSRATLLDHFGKVQKAFSSVPSLICYSVKANSCLGVLAVLKKAGAGFDVVSAGELERVRRVGGRMDRVVFAGVGKTDAELAAALRAGILMFNVESEAELCALDALAGKLLRARQIARPARVALRVNPDVDPHTHAYITTGKKETKFGLDLETTARLLKTAARFRNLTVAGLHAHIGSQITEVDPYREALKKVVGFILEHRCEAAPLTYLNSGGGFGIYYQDRSAPPVERFARVMLPAIKESGCTLLLEPGRFVCGNAGILVTRITYVKHSGRKRFLIVDAGMNDLVRPSLYGAFHEIWPVQGAGPSPTRGGHRPPPSCVADVVGPICESGDFLAKDRPLPKDLQRGDLLAIFSAGAYGRTMSSNYNTRPMCPEILVSGNAFAVATRRQTCADILACERVPKGVV